MAYLQILVVLAGGRMFRFLSGLGCLSPDSGGAGWWASRQILVRARVFILPQILVVAAGGLIPRFTALRAGGLVVTFW